MTTKQQLETLANLNEICQALQPYAKAFPRIGLLEISIRQAEEQHDGTLREAAILVACLVFKSVEAEIHRAGRHT